MKAIIFSLQGKYSKAFYFSHNDAFYIDLYFVLIEV